jgi:Uma2 family endonuclease
VIHHPISQPTLLHVLHNSAEGYEIMGMPAPEAITTIEELLALPEDGMRHELLDGEHVVTPAPRFQHQDVLREVFALLYDALRERTDLIVLTSPADIYLGPRTLVQPDLFIVQIDPERRKQISWKEVPRPLLTVEILSPSTAARDRGKKRRIYLESGIEEYWIVDIDACVIERWKKDDERPEIVDGELVWDLSAGVSGTVDVPKLFA